MSEELRPCPFCGESVELDYSELPNRKHWFITCECCGMMYQSSISQRKYVKVDWNNRPIEDALNARIAELEAENDILKDHLREAKNILIDKNLQIDSLYEEGYKLQQRIAELEAENAALKAEPKPLAYWSDEKKQTYADNEGRSAKRSEE